MADGGKAERPRASSGQPLSPLTPGLAPTPPIGPWLPPWGCSGFLFLLNPGKEKRNFFCASFQGIIKKPNLGHGNKMANHMKGPKMGTSLTKAQKAELQATNDLFSGVENTGLENVNSDDLLIPRITILQALSPQLKKSKPEYIPDAEEGDICEVAMGTIIPSPMIFLPVYYKKQWLEWAPRSTGQGLVAVHDSQKILTQCTQDEKGRWFTESGNSIGETAQFFGLNLSSPGRMRCFLPMAASQLRKARKLLTLSTSEKIRRSDGSEFTPPLYYRSYELGICDENNTEGDWKGWTVSRAASLPELDLGVPWSNVLEEATTFLDSLIKGEARGDMSGIGEEGNSSSGAGNQSDTDDSRGM